MSDAKAKAEARRAKILARENKNVSAVSVDPAVTLFDSYLGLDCNAISKDETASVSKERPLATRRSYVNALAKGDNSSKEEDDSKENTAQSTIDTSQSNSEPDQVDSSDKYVHKNPEVDSKKEDSPKLTEKEVEFTPKHVREIEKEIAENTAKFDAQTLKKSEEKNEKKILDKKKPPIVSNIQPASLLKLIRLVVIIALGAHIGSRLELH